MQHFSVELNSSSNCFTDSLSEQDLERIQERGYTPFRGILFGCIFSSPFWALLAYCYWWVR